MSVETQNKEDGEFVRVNNHDEDEEAQVRKLTAPLFDTEDSKVEEEDNGDENTNKKQVQWDN